MTLNANIRSVKQIIHATQGENGSRTLEITIIGTDGEILNLDGCTISFYVSKNDGKIAMLPVNISGNTARVTLTEQSCSVAGDNDCWIQIVKSSETAELRVDNLVLRVQACDFDGAVESSNEFVTLTQKIVEANEAIKNANQAADDVRKDGAQAIQEINQNFNTAMTGFTQEIDAAVKKAEDAAGKSEEIAHQAAIDTISSQKNKANGIAGLNASGKLQQMPTAADVGAVPTSRTINGKALTGNITITAADIGISAIFLAAHPVGDIYLSVNPTNPGTLYGGTWVAWGSGRVPVGVNTSDTDFKTVEKTGGAKTHTLTVQEIPNHAHDLNAVNEGVDNPNGGYHPGWTFNKQYTAQVMSASTGGGQAHNNLQPYITCYMWKRTA